VKLFRWRAIAPLTLILGLIALGWFLFGDRIVRRVTEDSATTALGTEVDIGWLQIRTAQASVELRGLEVADPFNPMRNQVEAGRIVLDLDPLPLLQKKVVIDRMVLTGLRFGSTRRRPAKPVKGGDGVAARVLSEIKTWTQQFKQPLLSLTPVDTIKAIALDPTKLGTIKAVEILSARADSVQRSLESGLKSADYSALVDSANALANRLSATNPSKLGVAGTAEAANSVKRTLDQIARAKQQLAELQKGVTGGVALLSDGLKAVDDAREKDYAFARGLMKLPGLDAPNIGAALFGASSASTFQQALYYGRMAQQYIPPGLQPWRKSGPKRLRMRGITVVFPKEHATPSFLLRDGKLSFSLGADTTVNAFSGSVTGLTTQPALYGRPTTFGARGALSGPAPISARLDGILDHVRATPRDSIDLSLGGVKLPAFDLPTLPFRLDPGVGDAALAFVLNGDRVGGRLSVKSNAAQWATDSTRGKPTGGAAGVVWQVVSGLKELDLKATLSGTVTAPNLSISSNLDQAVSDRLKAMAGDQLAKGEARAKAEVDRLVQDKVEPVRQKVTQAEAALTGKLGGNQQALDGAQKRLEAELKRLGPAGGLPKIKLP